MPSDPERNLLIRKSHRLWLHTRINITRTLCGYEGIEDRAVASFFARRRRWIGLPWPRIVRLPRQINLVAFVGKPFDASWTQERHLELSSGRWRNRIIGQGFPANGHPWTPFRMPDVELHMDLPGVWLLMSRSQRDVAGGGRLPAALLLRNCRLPASGPLPSWASKKSLDADIVCSQARRTRRKIRVEGRGGRWRGGPSGTLDRVSSGCGTAWPPQVSRLTGLAFRRAFTVTPDEQLLSTRDTRTRHFRSSPVTEISSTSSGRGFGPSQNSERNHFRAFRAAPKTLGAVVV